MLKKLGFLALLFPVALLEPVTAIGLSALLFVLSFSVTKKLNFIDITIAGMVGLTLFYWAIASDYGRMFIGTHVGAYFAFLFVLRFLYVCREEFLTFIYSFPLYAVLLLCLVYIAAQVHIGYVYEFGVLESFILIRMVITKHRRITFLWILLIYLVIMHLISTRTTPLAIAAIISAIVFISPSKKLMSVAYISVIALTPFIGYFLMLPGVSESLAVVDDNAAIRYEMLKSATSTIGFSEFLWGSGFGTPYRDPRYVDYAFWHPLLNDIGAVYQVSSHNSLFDVFYRFGLVLYIVFAVVFLVCLGLHKAPNKYFYALLFVGIYSLYSNAYLDSGRLAHVFSVIAGGAMFVIRFSPKRVGHPRRFVFNRSRFIHSKAAQAGDSLS